MMTRVLLTGGAGFIGSHVAEALLSRGDRVVVLDNFDEFYDPAIKRRNIAALLPRAEFSLIEGDIRDRALVSATYREHGVDAVIHLAAKAGVRPSLSNPATYAEVNVLGTTILLEEAHRAGVGRFVFASSSSVYGQRSDPPFRETDRVDLPISPYAATKKAGELVCHTFHHAMGMDVTCLRFFTVYGPRQRPEMAIHRFCRLMRAGSPIVLFGDGRSARDYTFVEDIVDGTLRALDRVRGYHIYNLGGAGVTTLSRLIEVLAGALGVDPVISRQPMQPGDVLLTSASVDLAARELGFVPRVAIEEGVARFVDWLSE